MPDPYVGKLERDLTSGVLHLLILLEVDRSGPIHGYGLIRAMADTVRGEGAFKEGTVYPILSDLEKSGIIRGRWGQGAAGPPRKYYELTAAGRNALKEAVGHWRRIHDGIQQALDKPRGRGTP